MQLSDLKNTLRLWAHALGFADLRVSAPVLANGSEGLKSWLAQGFHGEMDYMARHLAQRENPALLMPEVKSILSLRMDYWPQAADAQEGLAHPERAYISRYALGRDYHKLMRQRIKQLAERIEREYCAHIWRPFSDSAPVQEVDFATQSGLGWTGKHSLLLTRTGSWHFLGELYTSLELPPDPALANGHCGRCRACIDACPTAAIVADGVVDARRCISYLTIECAGAIPVELRPLMGNRIYGCDDCQLYCPWNRFTTASREPDFAPRHNLDKATLLALFAWDEATFLDRMAGSPIRRIGFERWRRNLAVALGNAPASAAVSSALQQALPDASMLLREHVEWAIRRHHSTP
jgi:epoxyqueuosine reductase